MSGNLADARRRLRDLLASLEQLLDEERAALARRDAATLEGVLVRKQALLDELQAQAPGAAPERMARDDLGSDEQADWQAVRDSLARCAQANETNGAAVALGRQSMDQLFNLLTGRTGGSNVYDARGRLHLAGDPQRTREQV